MKSISIALLSVLSLVLAGAGCESRSAQATIANPDPTRCIVSGEKLPAKPVIVEVNGKKFALCCAGCEEQLRKDPEGFLAHPGTGSMGGMGEKK